MGTSSSYGGPGGGTPLVPSWLGPADDGPTSPDGAGDTAGDTGSGDVPVGTEPSVGTAPEGPPSTPPASPDLSVPQPAPPRGRFSAPRSNLSRFAGSGGSDSGSLARAVSGYVSGAAGGAKNAARRMGASRRAGAQLLSFLGGVQGSGVREALRALNLDSLAGRPAEDIFLALVDFVCPNSGTVDDGIARDAFIETIAELSAQGITDLEALSADQMRTVFEIYATHAIEARLCNDIGANAVALPVSAFAAASVQAQIRDFIRRGVADALVQAQLSPDKLTQENVLGLVDGIYENAFEILRSIGDAEGEET